MTLQDIFDELTYGELSQLAVGGRDSAEPEIAEEDRPGLVRHVGTALTAIYTRFRLREKSVFVQMVPGKTTYVLHQKFLINNTTSDEPVKFLLDSEDDVFDGSLLKVESVNALAAELDVAQRGDDPYVALPLNEVGNFRSVRTPSTLILQIPDYYHTEQDQPLKLRVDYRAVHPPLDIPLAVAAPIAVEIELPDAYLQALLYNVASRIMNPVGMSEEFHSGNSYYAKYENECARLELENVQIDNMQANTNFERQGFV